MVFLVIHFLSLQFFDEIEYEGIFDQQLLNK